MNRTQEIFNELYQRIAIKTDRIFLILFIFQWLMGIVFAWMFSPYRWEGNTASLHPHVIQAVFLGGLIAVLPVYLILKQPGAALNRYVVAVSQILFSVLFIHFTEGRIESHFHIFGSLAFIAFYRDSRALLLATVLTALDHLVRGYYWPQSVYGVLTASPLRALEHTAWVLFEDSILLYSIYIGRKELMAIAEKQHSLEGSVEVIEREVALRTQELKSSQEMVLMQQQSLTSSAKLSALGEMAAGIAHEINNPLAIISLHSSQLKEMMEDEELNRPMLSIMATKIDDTSHRIARIIKGLRTFSRDAGKDAFEKIMLQQLVEDTLSFCQERIKSHGIRLTIDVPADLFFWGRSTELSQVLLNLLNNASDAIQSAEEKWIKISAEQDQREVVLRVTDSGSGIPTQLSEKLFQPFFTTKELGKGTGLGLSISLGIIKSHQGHLSIDPTSPHTCFMIRLPLDQKNLTAA